MACGCGNRMRKYVLPVVGYTKQDDVWRNPNFPDENLRVITENEVDTHHTSLTSKIVFAVGKERFKVLLKSWQDGTTG